MSAASLVVTSELACPVGCCVVHYDTQIRQPARPSLVRQWGRPMFEVLAEPPPYSGDLNERSGTMRIPATEYDRPDRIFL